MIRLWIVSPADLASPFALNKKIIIDTSSNPPFVWEIYVTRHNIKTVEINI